MPLTPIIISSPEQERWLNSHVPYRIEMLRGLEIYKECGGKSGSLNPVLPSIFESALIACRWTASFLGLYVNRLGSLQEVTQRRKQTDVFAIDLGGTLIDPITLPQFDLNLLTSVFKGANVASAHPTREGIHTMTHHEVNPAAQLLIGKIKTHLYDVLRIPVPTLKR